MNDKGEKYGGLQKDTKIFFHTTLEHQHLKYIYSHCKNFYTIEEDYFLIRSFSESWDDCDYKYEITAQKHATCTDKSI